MDTCELEYDLPEELIAQQPAQARADCRLLVLERATGQLTDSRFAELGQFLRPGDCLVLNDTKVLQARFVARRASGGRIEGLFLRQEASGAWQVMLRPSRRIRVDEHIEILARDGQVWTTAQVAAKRADRTVLIRPQVTCPAEQALDQIGLPPLPPYIKRDSDPATIQMDRIYYQTVYARNPGAVAAPTAGLHFTSELLAGLAQQGVKMAYVTLHVGPGSFRPVAAERLEDHKVSTEQLSVSEQSARIINQVKSEGGRIVAVGTTAVRAIETAAVRSEDSWVLGPYDGQTSLYILPGYRFQITDAMITNFHLPRSTLLALVAAFAGLQIIMKAYAHAVARAYRFYSYGDAMLIL